MPTFDQGWGLLAAVANYPSVQPLPQTVLDDAADLETLLIDPGRCGYPASQVRSLRDARATAEEIVDGLEWLARSASSDATVIVYFSGHGLREAGAEGSRNYLLGYDAHLEEPISGVIEGEELSCLLGEIRTDRLVVVLDCCHAGGAAAFKSAGGRREVELRLDANYYDRLKTGRGRTIIASSRADEESLILEGMRNSLFTHYLLEGLCGAAADEAGEIKLFDLFRYVSAAVPAHDARQHPILKSEMETDFTLALGPPAGAGERSEPGRSREGRAIRAKAYFEKPKIDGSTFNF